jgi:predicted TPR repeat methyltransferase
MPYSAKSFDFMLQQHIKLLNPTSILDVGAGAGKNGKLIRETGYKNNLECLEPTAEYVNKFKLDTIYDTVHPVSLQQFVETQYKFQYDVVVFGDVLEHLFRSKVIDYIDYFLYK